MAQIMFLLRERSEDGEIDESVFVAADWLQARIGAHDYLAQLLADGGVPVEDGQALLDQWQDALDAERPTPSCRAQLSSELADRELTLEAVVVYPH